MRRLVLIVLLAPLLGLPAAAPACDGGPTAGRGPAARGGTGRGGADLGANGRHPRRCPGAAPGGHPTGGDGQPPRRPPRPRVLLGAARRRLAAAAHGRGRPDRVRRTWSPPPSARQGTGTTPLGTYGLVSAFGMHAENDRWQLRYREVRRGDYWVQDNGSDFYNRYRNKRAGRFPVVAAQQRPELVRATAGLPPAVRVGGRHGLQLGPGTPPRGGDLPARQRERGNRGLRERPAQVHPEGDVPARRRPGAGDRGGSMTTAGSEVHVDVEGRTLKLSNLQKVLYPAHGHHQGRGARLLRPDRSGAAPAPRRPAGHPDPLAARRADDELLREERARRHPVLGAHRGGADHRLPGTEPARRHLGLPDRRGPRHA